MIMAREEAVCVTVTGEKAFKNSFTGQGNSSVQVAMYTDEHGSNFFGFLPGEDRPYMPVGGRKVLAELLGTFIWMPYQFSETVQLKKGRKF